MKGKFLMAYFDDGSDISAQKKKNLMLVSNSQPQ